MPGHFATVWSGTIRNGIFNELAIAVKKVTGIDFSKWLQNHYEETECEIYLFLQVASLFPDLYFKQLVTFYVHPYFIAHVHFKTSVLIHIQKQKPTPDLSLFCCPVMQGMDIPVQKHHTFIHVHAH